MSKFVKVANVADILPGERLWVDFDEQTVIVFNVGGAFYCIADLCTHDDGPLEDGALEGHEVECPRHGARFDIRTGEAKSFPAFEPTPTYEVRIENGDVLVESPY